MTVEFFVAGVAQTKGSTRSFVPKGWTRAIVTSSNPKLKEWQTLVSLEAARHVPQGPFQGPVVVELLFLLQRPQSLARRIIHCITKPDIDKLERAILDGLTGIAFRDDGQVTDVHKSKRYGPQGQPLGVRVRVRPTRDFEPTPFEAASLCTESAGASLFT